MACRRTALTGDLTRNTAGAALFQPQVASEAGMPSEVAAVGSVMGDAETHAPARGSPRAAAKATPRRQVVVSNRVGPIGRDKAAQGGLAVALRAALEHAGGIWFGYSGSISEKPNQTPKLTNDRNVTAAVVDLSRRDYDEY